MLLSVKGTWSRGSGKLGTEPAESQGELSLRCLAPHQVLAYARVCACVCTCVRVCACTYMERLSVAWRGVVH